MNAGETPAAAAEAAKVTEDDRALAGGMYEAYRAKLTELNASKGGGGNPMPSWGEVDPLGHVAACWVQAAEFVRAHLVKTAPAPAAAEGPPSDFRGVLGALGRVEGSSSR